MMGHTSHGHRHISADTNYGIYTFYIRGFVIGELNYVNIRHDLPGRSNHVFGNLKVNFGFRGGNLAEEPDFHRFAAIKISSMASSSSVLSFLRSNRLIS